MSDHENNLEFNPHMKDWMKVDEANNTERRPTSKLESFSKPLDPSFEPNEEFEKKQ